jgi:hypothetical protein
VMFFDSSAAVTFDITRRRRAGRCQCVRCPGPPPCSCSCARPFEECVGVSLPSRLIPVEVMPGA